MVFFKEVWPWNEFEKFVVFSTIRQIEGWEVNFFIREIFEAFHFPSDFIVVAKNF